LKEAKRIARMDGRHIYRVIEDALQAHIERYNRRRERQAAEAKA
jgi:hypothetical protein